MDNIYCVLLKRAADDRPAFMFVQWSEGMALPEKVDARRRVRKALVAPAPITRGAYVHGIMKDRFSGFTIQRYQLLRGGVHTVYAKAVALGLLPLFEPVIGSWDALSMAPVDAFPWEVCANVATHAHEHFERVKRAEELYKVWYGDAPGQRRKYYIGYESYFAAIGDMYCAAKVATLAYVQSVVADGVVADGVVADALAKMRARAAEGCMPMETPENDDLLHKYTAVRVPIVLPGL